MNMQALDAGRDLSGGWKMVDPVPAWKTGFVRWGRAELARTHNTGNAQCSAARSITAATSRG
ncbi:hypothetical protein [Rhizobium sp. BR 314]|uniref:hypothetical protein n=1 Tax=Rhizobium sp. BR 314 TaxID=3040013 RepID=UPI0039BF2B5E